MFKKRIVESMRSSVGIRSIFFADPDRGSSLKDLDPDPDLGNPKRPDPTGSGSYLDMFLMFSKINNFLWHFYPKSKHFMTLKIKDKKLV